MARLFTPDGKVKKLVPQNGKVFTSGELNRIVEGFVEILWLGGHDVMIVNEEGKVFGQPFNKKATARLLATRYHGQEVVGNALLCDVAEIN